MSLAHLFDKNLEHIQTIPSKIWIITHNLNKYPAITLLDANNREIKGEVKHNSINQITVTFNQELTGKVIFN
jgi:hypothetical protein